MTVLSILKLESVSRNLAFGYVSNLVLINFTVLGTIWPIFIIDFFLKKFIFLKCN